MKTKAKKFSHKLLALFLAVVMGLTCFTGVISAYGSSSDVSYVDGDVQYNSLGWHILSDEQVATALLDYADQMLAQYGPQIDSLLKGALPTSGMYYYNASERHIHVNVAGLITANVAVYTHSVDELLVTLNSVEDTIADKQNLVGDAGNLHFYTVKNLKSNNDRTAFRDYNSSCDIIRAILGILEMNSRDINASSTARTRSNDVLGEFLSGGFDLGTLGTFVKVDIYGLLGNLIGAPSGYQSNMVYNIIKSLLLNNTDWFTAEEKLAYNGGGTLQTADGSKTVAAKDFIIDDVLIEKLTTELLDKISVLVTYDENDSSATRKEKIDALMSNGKTYAQACDELGYDSNLVYSTEKGMEGNILLFAYGDDAITLSPTDSLFTFGYKALQMAWNTVLKDTLNLVHVNSNVDRGNGKNFDNEYYYWACQNIEGGWDSSNLAAMYSEANINKWAAAQAAEKDITADAFLEGVKDTLTFDRDAAEDATGKWSDINATTIFNKLRYSPLADYGFNMTTGPINLYLLQTGISNLENFFENSYKSYSSMVAGLNDALVAAVKDLFPNRANIYKANDSVTYPTLNTTGNFTSINDSAVRTISTTLVNNALDVIQYTADSTDANILNGFYKANAVGTKLTEQNIEGAMIPLLVACIGQVNLGSGKLMNVIHHEDWDACVDAEGVAFVALREYLSYVLPNKDYDSLGFATTSDDGSYTYHPTLEGSILPMARDAVVYVMESLVPVRDKDGNPWKVEDREISDSETLFSLLNSVICYYGGDFGGDDWTIDARKGERAMGVAALLGLCDSNGNGTIKLSNSLWENLDQVVNKYIPLLGELYGVGAGKISTEEIIYNGIVKGFLEIGDTSIHASGMGGVSNFIYKALTVVSGDAIQSTTIVNSVYRVVKDLINGLFGARYSGQFTNPIPDSSSNHPFNDIVQISAFRSALQAIICNFVEFTGFGYKSNSPDLNANPDSALRGITFALQAVNTFIPEAITSIGDQSLKMATMEFENASVSGCQAGTTYPSTIKLTNNSLGVNSAYVDGTGEYDEAIQNGRYFISITDVSASSNVSNVADLKNSIVGQEVEPGKFLEFDADVAYQPTSSANPSNSAEVTVTYNIYDSDSFDNIAENLTTTAYLYLSSAQSWADSVYPAGTSLNSTLQSGNAGATTSVNGETAKTTAATSNGLRVTRPDNVVLGTDNLSAVNGYKFILWSNDSKSIDGVYYYDDKAVVDDITGKTVTVSRVNIKPIFDEETGDILKNGYYDYTVDGGKTWNRGDNNNGYTSEETGTIYNSASSAQQALWGVRTHVAYYYSEIESNIYCYHKEDGKFVDMYLKDGGSHPYTEVLPKISTQGAIDGFYLNAEKKTANTKEEFNIGQYDGTTSVTPGTYSTNMCAYNSTASVYFSFDFVIGDTKSSSSLNSSYSELLSVLSNYRKTDFASEEVYTQAREAILNALAAKSTPLTSKSAASLSDTTQLSVNYGTTTNSLGDVAYQPIVRNSAGVTSPVSIPSNITVYWGDGTTGQRNYAYFDEACTMPIYSNVQLTTATSSKGKYYDAVGTEVAKDSNGTYHLVNTPQMVQEWNVDDYTTPYKTDSSVQATDNQGNLLYNQVQYTYRTSDSKQVNSDDDWTIKFPVSSEKVVPNTEIDYRGVYTQANDYLNYVIELVDSNIDKSVAKEIFEDVSLERKDLNETNFDVVTYNKMTSLAKTAENKYTLTLTYNEKVAQKDSEGNTVLDSDGNVVYDTVNKTVKGVSFNDYKNYLNNDKITDLTATTVSSLSKVQVDEYVRLYNLYKEHVLQRGYLGDKIEAEIECASGATYDKLTATPAVYSEDGKTLVSAAVVKFASGATPRFGTVAADGTLENKDANGEQVFTNATWNAYVEALAKAANLVTKAHSSDYDDRRDEGAFDPSADYYASVTEVYTIDTALQVAEIALTKSESATVTVATAEGGSVTVNGTPYSTPVAAEVGSSITLKATANDGYTFKYFDVNGRHITTAEYTFTLEKDTVVTPVFEANGHKVTASLVIATNAKGDTKNVGVSGDYTVTVYDSTGSTEVLSETFALTHVSNSFEITLPSGTYTATISSKYSLPRTVTINVGATDVTGPAIPIIACDFDGNGTITTLDKRVLTRSLATANELYDLDGNGTVTSLDARLTVALLTSDYSKFPAVTIE